MADRAKMEGKNISWGDEVTKGKKMKNITSSDNKNISLLISGTNSYLSIIILQQNISMTKIQNRQEITFQEEKPQNLCSGSSFNSCEDLCCLQQSRRLPSIMKESFFNLVTKRNFTMKEAAREVGMSYSTAKKIYSKFRKSLLKSKRVERNACELVQAKVKDAPQGRYSIMVISLIAGKEQ